MAEKILDGRLPGRNCKRKCEKEHLEDGAVVIRFAVEDSTAKDAKDFAKGAKKAPQEDLQQRKREKEHLTRAHLATVLRNPPLDRAAFVESGSVSYQGPSGVPRNREIIAASAAGPKDAQRLKPAVFYFR